MIGSVTARDIETKVVRPTIVQLLAFSRQELRDYAEAIGVNRGQNKRDTINNLMASNKATILIQLGN